VIAALAEVLIWRAFSRIGVFIPKDEPRLAGFKAFYEASVKVGEVLRNFAVVLAFLAVALMTMKLRQLGLLGFRQRPRLNKAGEAEGATATVSGALTVGWIATIVVFAVTGALLGLVESNLGSLILRLAMIVGFGGFALDYWQQNRAWVQRVFISLLFAGYLLPNAAKILHDSIFPVLGINGSQFIFEPLLELGELAVIANAILLFIIYTQRGSNNEPRLWKKLTQHWIALTAALVLTGIFIGLTFLTVAESFIVPILGLYVLGYGMHWPLLFYIMGLFLLLYTLFYCLAHSRSDVVMRAGALGLTLLFLGGYSFNISDQYLFALVGVLLIARPALANWE
jgi:hypothetical protein